MRILYIDIDSCRPDHLGCYGYRRSTSPVIDELAKRSVLFRNCHTSDAPCLPSRAALFSGRFGITNGVTCHEGPASQLRYPGRLHSEDRSRLMWMRSLQQAGWETISFSSFAKRHLAWWFCAGFTQFFGNQLPGGSESASEVSAKVLPWLRTHGAADQWFLHVTYWDVHIPYRAPEAYYARVRGKPAPDYPAAEVIAYDASHYYGPRTARDWWCNSGWQNPQNPLTSRMPQGNPDTFANYLGFLDGYDAGIAYTDEKIGELLEELQRLGVLDETAIIVSADHGEAIGELGMYFEHGNCCEGTTHVPLIIHWPGGTEQGSVCEELLYQLDLPPTVLELLGLEIPLGWDGASFAPAVRQTAVPFTGRKFLAIGCGIYCYQRAVRVPHYRLLRTIHSGLYPYDSLYLFDMEVDPHQTRNIAADRPEIVAELDHFLLDWTYRYTTGPAGVRDPFQEQLEANRSPDVYCSRAVLEQRLMALGREDQLADLRWRRDSKPPLKPW